MKLPWPTSYPPARLGIPVVSLEVDEARHKEWKRAQRPWQQSGRTDYSVWGEYAGLVQSGRFRLPNNGQRSYRFAECHTALWLKRQGYTCWSGIQLFAYGKSLREGFKQAKTDEVRAIWGKRPWPGQIQHELVDPRKPGRGRAYRPRNPDIVGYHEKRREWLFCEVKKWDDRISPDQLTALAVLHLLTGDRAIVVQLVKKGHTRKGPDVLKAEIEYREDAAFRWIKRAVLAGGRG